MAQDLDQIRRFVRRLVLRERLLLLARVVLQGALVGLAVLSLAVVASVLRWNHSSALVAMVVVAGVGVWSLVALPVLAAWRRSGDVLRQARLTENIAPELRGRLLTSVERVDGPRRGESADLLGMIAHRATHRLESVRLGAVHPLRSVSWLGVLTGLVATLAVIAVGLGPFAVIDYWLGDHAAHAEVARVQKDEAGAQARIGDIGLTYVYPDYTGLEPLTVDNVSGDLHGPPGTVVEISALSALVVDSAALVAYEQPPTEATVEEGRRLEATVTIGKEPGTWHLVMFAGGIDLTTRMFRIDPEPDLPPEVTVDAEQTEYELGMDEVLRFGWTAKDDYGLREVQLQVTGREPQVLRKARERVASLSDRVRVTPRDLGMKPGDVAELSVLAWDNDTWSGQKAGVSATIKVRVLGEDALDERLDEKHEELIEVLLVALADFLEEPFPPGVTQGELAAWGEVLSRRYEPIGDLIETNPRILGPDAHPKAYGAPIATAVWDDGRALIRYTQVSFAPRSNERAIAASLDATRDLRDKAVGSLEEGIVALDRVLQLRALARLVQQAGFLAEVADSMQDAVSREAAPYELQNRLDRSREILEQMKQTAGKLDDSGVRDLVQQRGAELGYLEEEIRSGLAANQLADARMLSERMARQMKELRDALARQLKREEQEGDDLKAAVQEVLDELERLEAEQHALREQVAEAREDASGEDSANAEKLWERAAAAAKRAADRSGTQASKMGERDREFFEREIASAADEATDRLKAATEARDLNRAIEQAMRAQQEWRNAERAADTARRLRGERGTTPEDAQRMSEIQRGLDEVASALEQLEQQARAGESRMGRATRGLEDQQRELAQQLAETSTKAEEVAQELWVPPQGMNEALDEGQQRMGEAGRELARGRPMPAEGAQGSAAQRVEDARQALERALQRSAQQMQQARGQGQGEGREGRGDREHGGAGDEEGDRREGRRDGDEEGRDDGDEEGRHTSDHDIKIPSPEEFQSPEEYRDALLQGMEGDVPEEFRALKKRYYEELVRQ